MPKSNSYKSYKVNLTRETIENQVCLKKDTHSVGLNSVNKNLNLRKTDISEIFVVRNISSDQLSKLTNRIDLHARFITTNIASTFLNKSKELKLLNCLYEDAAYINYLRNVHWIDITEHLYNSRRTEKKVHNNTIANIKEITTNLIKDNDDLLTRTLWLVEDNHNQKTHKLALRLMQYKIRIYSEQQNLNQPKSTDKKVVDATFDCPVLKDKMQVEALEKIDINKLTLPNLHALFKYLQAQTFTYENFENVKKWDKSKNIKTLQQKILDKFLKYNPDNLCDNINNRYTLLKSKFDRQLELVIERIKDQSLITKSQITEYEKNNLTHEEDIYWWNYAEIYKNGNSKFNRSIAIQNLYVKNLFWKIQEHNAKSANQIELNDLPGLIHPLRFSSEIKLNLINFEDKNVIANKKMLDDPSLAIELVNNDCKLEEIKDIKILSKFKNAKSFESRIALMHELAKINYEKVIQSNTLRYQRAKNNLMQESEANLANVEIIRNEAKIVNKLFELRETLVKQSKNKIEIEK